MAQRSTPAYTIRFSSFSLAFVVAVAALSSGCAYSHKTIETDASDVYHYEQDAGDFTFSYSYDALRASGNTRYAKKARKKGVSVVAVEVTNEAVTLSSNTLQVRVQETPVPLGTPNMATSKIDQTIWPHAFWALLWLNVVGESQEADGTPRSQVSLPIDAPIAIVNMVRSSRANTAMKRNLRKQALLGQEVGPGETVTGLIFLNDVEGQPLTFEVLPPPSSPMPANVG